MSTTTKTAPECCPFCGAARKPACRFAWFTCGTSTRRDQTPACAAGEHERLTRERDEAREERDTALALMSATTEVIVKMGKQIDRMEQAGNCLLIDNKSDANVAAWNKAKEFQP